MKVSDAKTGAPARAAQAAEPSTDAAKAAGTATSPAAANDRVTVAHSAVVDEASRVARADRTTRLKELESAVRAGSYKPDAGRIAERILDDAEITARLRAALR